MDIYARPFPHLITMGDGWNTRWIIDIASEPNPLIGENIYAVYGPDVVDVNGDITTVGNNRIRTLIEERARDNWGKYCIVWGPTSCTYYLDDGSYLESSIVPVGDPAYPEDYKNADAIMIDVETFEMPAAALFEILCVRRIGDQIELSTGRPKMLAYIDYVPDEGPGSELRSLFDENGKFVCPETYRGVQTTGYDDDGDSWAIYGPIQPDNIVREIVWPWPKAIYDACRKMAGCELNSELLTSVWQCVERLMVEQPGDLAA